MASLVPVKSAFDVGDRVKIVGSADKLALTAAPPNIIGKIGVIDRLTWGTAARVVFRDGRHEYVLFSQLRKHGGK